MRLALSRSHPAAVLVRHAGWAIVAAAAGLGAQQTLASGATWHVRDGDVRVLCPLTVGGSFEARTHAITGTVTAGEAGAPGGSLSVDLRTLDTGIALRNRHMRERYLEVDRGDGFDRAVLTDLAVDRAEAIENGGRTPFTATLTLHGISRPVAGDARLSRRDAAVHVEATFPVDLPDFEIASPRYLGVGVRDRVTVRVSFAAIPAS